MFFKDFETPSKESQYELFLFLTKINEKHFINPILAKFRNKIMRQIPFEVILENLEN